MSAEYEEQPEEALEEIDVDVEDTGMSDYDEQIHDEDDAGGADESANADVTGGLDEEDGSGEAAEVDGERPEGASADAPARTLKRPMGAYFLFMTEARPSIIAELDAAASSESAGADGPSKKRSLAAVGKLGGERWTKMPEEEKEVGTDGGPGHTSRGMESQARGISMH